MQQLSDFSAIILEWTRKMVRDRQSLTEPKSKTERLAPTLFDKDREGKHLANARAMRNLTIATRSVVSRDSTAQKQQ